MGWPGVGFVSEAGTAGPTGWMMALPPIPENLFRDEMDRFEKEREMPFIAPIERIWLEEGLAKGRAEGRTEGRAEGRTEGLYAGIELGLKLKFGRPGLDLMPRVRAVTDPAALDAFLLAIEPAPDLDTLRNLLPPQA
ncbi:MAG: hypothetical protein JWO38_7432 [Gemmataceae bacterium]|nr:hypothetical protein [Gemmataceae bacterium]